MLVVNLEKKIKACWLSKETKNGWRLAFSVGKKDYTLPGLLFKTRLDVKEALNAFGTVYVHLADSKTGVKGENT